MQSLTLTCFFLISTGFGYGKQPLSQSTDLKFDSLMIYFNSIKQESIHIQKSSRIIYFLPSTYAEYVELGVYIQKRRIPSQNDEQDFLNKSEIYDLVFLKFTDSVNRPFVYEKVLNTMKDCKIQFINASLAMSFEQYLYASVENSNRFFNYLAVQNKQVIRDFFLFVLGRSTFMGVDPGGELYEGLKTTHPSVYKELVYMRKKYPGKRP